MTATSWPRATSAFGRASTTSARPPVLENGKPSDATKRIRILVLGFEYAIREARRRQESEQASMKLIFLYGLPGTGKLTIARELADITGYKLFHNHLTVDLLLSMFEFGSKPFVELRELIWLSVMEEAAATLPAMIFTFNPENSVRQEFITKAVQTANSRGGEVHFVEVVCDPEELERRINTADRKNHKKLVSVELFHDLKAKGVFDSPK